MCSLHSKCFWQRRNIPWPFRRQPRSGHTVLCTAVCSVRELKYADICVCLCVTQYLSVDRNVSFPCLMWPQKRSFDKQGTAFTYSKVSNLRVFLKWREKSRKILFQNTEHIGWVITILTCIRVKRGSYPRGVTSYLERLCFPQFLQTYAGAVPQIRPRQLPTTPCSIHSSPPSHHLTLWGVRDNDRIVK
jgi:hypothetical protein